jgi:tetratricopeptide (TPR) repeat protein
MALASNCYGWRLIHGWMTQPAADIALGAQLAIRAVELGQDDGNVLWLAAHAILYLARDHTRARELVHRSLDLNPNSAAAVTMAGVVETMSGNPAEALELLHRALRLSPRDPRGWHTYGTMALAHLAAGQFEAAASLASRALLYNPRFVGPIRVLVSSLSLLDRRAGVAEALERLRAIDPEFSLPRLRARLGFMHERLWKPYAEGLKLAGFQD